MCGFIAQLAEQRTGNAEVTGSNPVEALIFFFQASSFQLLKLGKFTAMIILHFQNNSCYATVLLKNQQLDRGCMIKTNSSGNHREAYVST